MNYQNLKNQIERIKKLPQILVGDTNILITNAKIIGEYISRGRVTTSQLRNIFDATKRIRWKEDNEEETINELNLLRPKMAFLSGRHHKIIELKNLQKILDKAIREVVNSKDRKKFNEFQDFFEAITAYHRYYGGKE